VDEHMMYQPLDGQLTEVTKIMFEIISEVVTLPHRAIKEVDIDDVVGILVCHFNHTYEIIRCVLKLNPLGQMEF